MPKIIVKQKNKIVKKFQTDKDIVTIGRDRKNDIFLDSRRVSRDHAEIIFYENYASIIDHNSTNGTFVNGRKIKESIINESDEILIGEFSIQIKLGRIKKSAIPDYDTTIMVGGNIRDKKLSEEENIIKARPLPFILRCLSNCQRDIPIMKKVLLFGKGNDVDIKVKGFFVSRIQAKLELTENNFKLTNIGRKGKVKVNGEKIDTCILRFGDEIRIGSTIFKLERY